MNVEIILSMAGGLGLFLFGMKGMSESSNLIYVFFPGFKKQF